MRKYWSFFRLRFINGLQYRAAAWAGVVTQFAWGFLEIGMFAAFYRADPSAIPMPFPELASYIWLQQAFLALFMTWFMENELFDAIAGGGIAYELCRPVDLYAMWFARSMAKRLSGAVLRCMPILLVAVFLPAPYNLGPPVGIGAFLAFLLSLTLGFLVVVAFCMLLYVACFFTLSPTGLRFVAVSLVEFLSGAIVPLPFLPDTLRRVVELLPFASMQNMPLRIYSGNVAGRELLAGLMLQAVWLLALTLAGTRLMKRAMRRVVVQGG